jgi:chromosome segregation ATPase
MLRLKNTSLYICLASMLISGIAVADPESWIQQNAPQREQLKQELQKLRENRSNTNSFANSGGNAHILDATSNQIENLKSTRRILSKQKQPNKAQLRAIDQQISRLKTQQKDLKRGSKKNRGVSNNNGGINNSGEIGSVGVDIPFLPIF